MKNTSIDLLISSQKKFVGFLHARVGNLQVAEDIFQSSILKAIKAQGSLENKEALIPWFYKILKNSVSDYFRENKKMTEKSDEISRFILELENETEFSKKSFEALCNCFNGLMPGLNPTYADLLQKIDLNGEDLKEVAKETHTTISTMTVKLHRARQALKKSLEAACGACAKHGCLNCTCGK